jgi:hypothetical protein
MNRAQALKILVVILAVLPMVSLFLVSSVAANSTPTLSLVTASTNAAEKDHWFHVNMTVQDLDGYSDLANATLELSNVYHIILGWTSLDTFSIYQGSTTCALDLAGCSRTVLNSTSYLLTWQICFTERNSEDIVCVLSANTKVFDLSNASATGSDQIGLFSYTGLKTPIQPQQTSNSNTTDNAVPSSSNLPNLSASQGIAVLLVLGGLGLLFMNQTTKRRKPKMKKQSYWKK